jgi:hypothetical protein
MNNPTVPNVDIASELIAIVEAERPQAEATLGRALIDPHLFSFNFWRHGLGHALNVEHDLIP